MTQPRRARRQADLKKRVDKAVEKAQAAGATGPAHRGQLTKLQRSLRDQAILGRLEMGMRTQDVAAEFGITSRGVEVVRERAKELRSPFDERPMDLIEGIARTYARAASDLMWLASKTVERNPAVALGSIRAAMDATERYEAMLAAAGKLPSNFELFRAESEMLRIGELMVERIDQLERGELTALEVGDFFRTLMTSHGPLADIEGSVHEDNSAILDGND